MTADPTAIRIFLASPGDVPDERERVGMVVAELNRTLGRQLGVAIELRRWETDARPGLGADAQDVINRQFDGDDDIFVGVMWKRVGTATGRARSGTIEEYERALHSWRSTGRPAVLFYFKQQPFWPASLEDVDQIRAVLEFRARLEEHGLVWQFESPDGFERALREHLFQQISDSRPRRGDAGREAAVPTPPSVGAETPELRARRRPAKGGYSIGNVAATAGTLGCLVRDAANRVYVLSAGSAIAPPGAKRGDPIVQPGPFDGGTAPADQIATLDRWYTLGSEPSAGLDAALALIDDPFRVSPEIDLVGAPRGVTEPSPGLEVRKVGRSSGLTSGRVDAIEVRGLAIATPAGPVVIEDVFLCTPMSTGGDSGALVLDADNRAVGMVIAGSSTATVCVPVAPVLEAFDVALVTGE